MKALPSRLQPKVLPASVDVKLKIALVLFVNAAGLEVILVSGAVVSSGNAVRPDDMTRTVSASINHRQSENDLTCVVDVVETLFVSPHTEPPNTDSHLIRTTVS